MKTDLDSKDNPLGIGTMKEGKEKKRVMQHMVTMKDRDINKEGHLGLLVVATMVKKAVEQLQIITTHKQNSHNKLDMCKKIHLSRLRNKIALFVMINTATITREEDDHLLMAILTGGHQKA